jgi:hypothetical protein
VIEIINPERIFFIFLEEKERNSSINSWVCHHSSRKRAHIVETRSSLHGFLSFTKSRCQQSHHIDQN